MVKLTKFRHLCVFLLHVLQLYFPTFSGERPLVIARGGFSGVFPDSSVDAYEMAKMLSVPDVIFWCDVQLTRDAAGICFPDLDLNNASTISQVFGNRSQTYPVNGVPTTGWFPVDFSLDDLQKNVFCKFNFHAN